MREKKVRAGKPVASAKPNNCVMTRITGAECLKVVQRAVAKGSQGGSNGHAPASNQNSAGAEQSDVKDEIKPSQLPPAEPSGSAQPAPVKTATQPAAEPATPVQPSAAKSAPKTDSTVKPEAS